MGKKSAITTEITEIQGSSSETLTNLNKHFTQIGSDLAENIPTSASSVNPEDYLR